MRPVVRVLLIGVLLVSVAALGVHYQTAGPTFPYPGPTAVATDYDDHVGSEVFFFGTVESVDPEASSARVAVGYAGGTLELGVSDYDARNVRPGGTVQIYGTLLPGHQVDARNVVAVNPTATTDRTKYLLSGVGALLVVVVFFRHWRVDTDEPGFVRR